MAYYPENDKKWRENNKEKARHGSYRRTARLFVKSYGTITELEDLKAQIEEKIQELKDGTL